MEGGALATLQKPYEFIDILHFGAEASTNRNSKVACRLSFANSKVARVAKMEPGTQNATSTVNPNAKFNFPFHFNCIPSS